MTAITQFWSEMFGPREAVSKEFEHMLMRQVMRSSPGLPSVSGYSAITVLVLLTFKVSSIRSPVKKSFLFSYTTRENGPQATGGADL